jgi:hypothetical protein
LVDIVVETTPLVAETGLKQNTKKCGGLQTASKTKAFIINDYKGF